MKKKLAFLFLSTSMTITAQIPDSGYASDFNVTAYQPWLSSTGLNNNGTYSLYEYLDLGYTVFIDFSATWCGPCWGVHISGTLDELYNEHGPAGFPGVSASTTNDVMVFWMEGDPATLDSEMENPLNWIEPTPGHQIQFPMFNPDYATTSFIVDDFNIVGFPYVVVVKPDRSVVNADGIAWGADSAYTNIFNPSLSITDIQSIKDDVSVYPNPATSIVNISSNNIFKSKIQLFDASGRGINCSYVILNDDNISLNTEVLSNGIYTLNVVDETIQNVKIIIQK